MISLFSHSLHLKNPLIILIISHSLLLSLRFRLRNGPSPCHDQFFTCVRDLKCLSSPTDCTINHNPPLKWFLSYCLQMWPSFLILKKIFTRLGPTISSVYYSTSLLHSTSKLLEKKFLCSLPSLPFFSLPLPTLKTTFQLNYSIETVLSKVTSDLLIRWSFLSSNPS